MRKFLTSLILSFVAISSDAKDLQPSHAAEFSFSARSADSQIILSPSSPLSGDVRLISGSLGWNEPLLGTSSGHTLVHSLFSAPATGWTNAAPARLILLPSPAFFSYQRLSSQPTSIQFRAILVGGDRNYQINYAGITAAINDHDGPGMVIPKPEHGWAGLFGEILSVYGKTSIIHREVPFLMPQLATTTRRSGDESVLHIHIFKGEPYSHWLIQRSESLDWSNDSTRNIGELYLNANGEAVAGPFQLLDPKTFYRLTPGQTPSY